MSSRFFLKVQDGCNQLCTYCLVPYLRGRSRSRQPAAVVKIIQEQAKKGVKEVVLCGIDLADYQPSLTFLLKKILRTTKIPRIRLGSVNPGAFHDEFISLWSDERLCPYFHLPIQSGCNRILKMMKRGYTFDYFKQLVVKLRERIPRVNIATDVLVGFPGETDEDFAEELRNLESLRLGRIHVFRYSPREGTRAAQLVDQISEKVKTKRAARVLSLSKRLKREFGRRFIGQTLKVLFENQKTGFWQGWSENYLQVKAKGKNLGNKILAVKIEKEKKGVLDGRAG